MTNNEELKNALNFVTPMYLELKNALNFVTPMYLLKSKQREILKIYLSSVKILKTVCFHKYTLEETIVFEHPVYPILKLEHVHYKYE